MSRKDVVFIGVTTQQSSTKELWPRWTEALGIDAGLVGMDIAPDAPPTEYRRAIQRLQDPSIAGAVITTHKMHVYRHCRDLFTDADPLVEMLGEVAGITKEDGKLAAHTIDPASSKRALAEMLLPRHWRDTGAEVLVLGGGGAGAAVALSLAEQHAIRITVADVRSKRLDRLSSFTLETEQIPPRGYADHLVQALPPYSLVVNATGLGKDAPGSPVSDDAAFPRHGVVWELNYRGDLLFLHQARRQQEERSLSVHDGWRLFLHGWAQALNLIFGTHASADDLEAVSGGPVGGGLSGKGL
jgi:shikimate 5-dehydrogenase